VQLSGRKKRFLSTNDEEKRGGRRLFPRVEKFYVEEELWETYARGGCEPQSALAGLNQTLMS